MPSDTFVTASPEWGWLVILYFFFGGIAGGSYALAALIHLFGAPEDRPLARIGYYVAFPAVLLCAPAADRRPDPAGALLAHDDPVGNASCRCSSGGRRCRSDRGR